MSRLTTLLLTLTLGVGCIAPKATTHFEPLPHATAAASTNQGGLQTVKTYGDGDPWPFRLVALGLSLALVGLGCHLVRKRRASQEKSEGEPGSVKFRECPRKQWELR